MMNTTYKIVRLKDSFSEKMAYAPRNKFFKTEEEQKSSIENRLQFLNFLNKSSKRCGFIITEEFVKDFIERND